MRRQRLFSFLISFPAFCTKEVRRKHAYTGGLLCVCRWSLRKTLRIKSFQLPNQRMVPRRLGASNEILILQSSAFKNAS